MNRLELSEHAQTRLQQRGVRHVDVEVILACSEEMADGTYFLTRRAAADEIYRRKKEIQTLERLRGQKIVVSGDTLVTCYRPVNHAQQRILRQRSTRK